MKFELKQASMYGQDKKIVDLYKDKGCRLNKKTGKPEISINSMTALLKFMHETIGSVVIDEDTDKNGEIKYSILIYDDYIE